MSEFFLIWDSIKREQESVGDGVKLVIDARKLKRVSFSVLDEIVPEILADIGGIASKVCLIRPRNRVCKGFLVGAFKHRRSPIPFKIVKRARDVDVFIKDKKKL
jgi:hypothetical protein